MRTSRQKRTSIPRRAVLSGSAKLVVATAAAATSAAAEQKPQRPAAADSRVKHVSPAGLAPAKGYTPVVVVTGGRTVYVSGQVPVDKSGALVGAGDLKAQTTQVFENVKAALEAAGATFADVVKLGFYVLDASQVQVVRDVRDRYVDTASPPASTLVEVRRLVRDEFLVEVDAIASVAD